jgi:uncharacterized membrane protein
MTGPDPMILTPILTAPFVIQLHVVAALCAIVLGPMAMLRHSRDVWHKRLGRAWVAAMLVTASSSFLINEARVIGPYSPIHLLSVLTLWGLWQIVADARAGQIAAHRRGVLALYTMALGVAGLFTLLPGRRMSDVFFPSAPWLGFGMSAVVLVVLILWCNRGAVSAPWRVR